MKIELTPEEHGSPCENAPHWLGIPQPNQLRTFSKNPASFEIAPIKAPSFARAVAIPVATTASSAGAGAGRAGATSKRSD
jgi:hypothetical protein